MYFCILTNLYWVHILYLCRLPRPSTAPVRMEELQRLVQKAHKISIKSRTAHYYLSKAGGDLGKAQHLISTVHYDRSSSGSVDDSVPAAAKARRTATTSARTGGLGRGRVSSGGEGVGVVGRVGGSDRTPAASKKAKKALREHWKHPLYPLLELAGLERGAHKAALPCLLYFFSENRWSTPQAILRAMEDFRLTPHAIQDLLACDKNASTRYSKAIRQSAQTTIKVRTNPCVCLETGRVV